MSPEAQRIAIAEACGYELRPLSQNPAQRTWQRYGCTVTLPDYLTDLNAMHEAEAMLDGQQQCRIHGHLTLILRRDKCENDWSRYHTTAAQRAEAFLRALNLWRDDA